MAYFQGNTRFLCHSMIPILNYYGIDCERKGKIAISVFKQIVKNDNYTGLTQSRLDIIQTVFFMIYTCVSKMGMDYNSAFSEFLDDAQPYWSEGVYLTVCNALKKSSEMMSLIAKAKTYRLEFTNDNNEFTLLTL